jgi:hypothetical protein
MRYSPRNIEIAFGHAGLTHYDGVLFVGEFIRMLQLRRFLTRHLRYPRRNHAIQQPPNDWVDQGQDHLGKLIVRKSSDCCKYFGDRCRFFGLFRTKTLKFTTDPSMRVGLELPVPKGFPRHLLRLREHHSFGASRHVVRWREGRSSIEQQLQTARGGFR